MSLHFTMKITDDRRDLERIRRALIQAAQTATQVGLFDGVPHPNGRGLTYAEVAAVQEFGTDKIPERPFIEETARSTRAVAVMASGLARVIRGQASVPGMYRRAGEAMREDMRRVITAWSNPPNAPFTIAMKGFNDPLIETGAMRAKVEFRVGVRR